LGTDDKVHISKNHAQCPAIYGVRLPSEPILDDGFSKTALAAQKGLVVPLQTFGIFIDQARNQAAGLFRV